MFLSKDDLKLAYGVDMEIGTAYVNRAVPVGNLYWNQRKIYIPEAPGYYFMPIFSDLLYRIGVAKEFLLDNKTFLISESILHSAALLEYKKISWSEHINEIKQVVHPHIINQDFFKQILSYLDVANKPISKGNLGTDFPSLNRADSYLLTLSCLPTHNINLENAIQSWYALMTYFLILDDLVDIKDDLKNNEENALIEAGLNTSGIEVIESMISKSHDILVHINPVLANRIDHKRKTMDLTSLIRSMLSE